MANEPMPLRLAVLIDADNASAKIADSLFTHIAKLGEASVRRLYGDFSGGQAKVWEGARVKHAIVPHQQFANVPGKNATDIALVIDAMDLLHAGGLDGFCIVSSDSDFTRLATRMRERGLKVFGFGRKDTAASFRQACWKFVDTETLVPKPVAAPAKAPSVQPAKAPPVEKVKAPPIQKMKASPIQVVQSTPPAALDSIPVTAPLAEAERLILRALGEIGAGGKWVALQIVINECRRLDPAFRAQNYGSRLFTDLVDRTTCLECKLEEGGSLQIRMKAKSVPTLVPKSPTLPSAAQSVVPAAAVS